MQPKGNAMLQAMIPARLARHLKGRTHTLAQDLREVWLVLPWDQLFQLKAEEARM